MNQPPPTNLQLRLRHPLLRIINRFTGAQVANSQTFFSQSSVAHLREAELQFHHSKHLLNLGAHLGLGPVFGSLRFVDIVLHQYHPNHKRNLCTMGAQMGMVVARDGSYYRRIESHELHLSPLYSPFRRIINQRCLERTT